MSSRRAVAGASSELHRDDRAGRRASTAKAGLAPAASASTAAFEQQGGGLRLEPKAAGGGPTLIDFFR